MQRPFFRDLLICLIPLLAAGYVTYNAYAKYQAGEAGGFKLGVDLSGGTILVYEVDRERTLMDRGDASTDPNVPGAEEASDIPIDKLAESLKKRIDPVDVYNITVRPVGKNRVEIIMPTGGSKPVTDADPNQPATQKRNLTTEEVEQKKAIISKVGSLEFRILANDADDAAVYRAAMDFFESAKTNPAVAEKLTRAAEDGAPPPPPPGEFKAFGEPATYNWVELGKQERLSLSLDNASENSKDPRRAAEWQRAAEARAKGLPYKREGSSGQGERTSMLIYSRPFSAKRFLKEDENKKFEYFTLTRSSDSVKVGGDISITARFDQDEQLKPAVGFRFNSYGANLFYSLTSKNKPSGDSTQGGKVARSLAIILDGKIISAPSINQAIGASGIIKGTFTKAEVDEIVELLRSGALPATLKPLPVSENAIGPTLGADTINRGTWAVLWAFVAVLVFMLIYYRFAGMVACVALFANLLLTVGFMAAVNATFTLPGLAGLVLMLGMAVDANVLIYERIREERDRGANLLTAIRNGYERAFPTIIDTHLSSIFTACVLYTVGNDQLKGFGVSLVSGLVISLFTSLFMTRLMFDFWLSRKWLHDLKMMRFFSQPNIHFMRLWTIMMPTTIILTIIGLGVFLWRGENSVNVDFRGGTAYGGRLTEGLSIQELRDLADRANQTEKLKVLAVEPVAGVKNVYDVNYADGTTARVALASDADGATEAEQIEDVKSRASRLPDVSVEQLFLADDAIDATKSRFFTIRTTEREPQLVQATIDRLFQKKTEDGKFESLLVKTGMEAKANGNRWELTFDRPTSPSFVSTLLDQAFNAAMTPEQRRVTRAPYDLRGIGEPEEGRFAKMELDIEPGVLDAAKVAAIMKEVDTIFESRPQPERLETFDSTLAAETRSRAFVAIVASWLAILMYLWFRFGSWTFGLAAVLCLIHDLCFTLGVIAGCHYLYDTFIGTSLLLQDFKIDLPAIAALLTLVGYSANDTIVVFDRIKEVRGKNPALTEDMINLSVNQTLSRTLLASLTTWLVVMVLYIFGGEGVHLFAFVMVIGVIVGTYSSIYVASPLLLLFGEGRTHTTPATAAATGAAGKPTQMVPESK